MRLSLLIWILSLIIDSSVSVCLLAMDEILLYGMCSRAASVIVCLKALHLALRTHLANGICESLGMLAARSLMGKLVTTCLWNLVQCAGVEAEVSYTILLIFFCLIVWMGSSPTNKDLVKYVITHL